MRPQTRALDAVASPIEWRDGLVVVTGEEGAGKTTFCLGLARRFESRTFLSMVPTPPPDASRFVHGLLADFGLASPGSPQPELPSLENLRAALERFLISLASLQSHVVVVMDDAQHVPLSVLEEVFRLATFAEHHPGILQIVLVGTPSLLEVLQPPAPGQTTAHVSRRHRLARSRAAVLAMASLAAAAVVVVSIYVAGATPPVERGTAPQPVSLSPDQSFPAFQSEALERAARLAAEPDVRGLLKLQDEVHSWDSQTSYASHAAVEGLLGHLERLTDEARRRQLEEDRRLILEGSGKQ
jgi:hypothetical protein